MTKTTTARDILVIPDSHAHPEHDNERCRWLGRYILETRPGTVVHIGDLADLPSISAFEVGTRTAWGRTYQADIDSAIEHQRLLWGAVGDWNAQRARNKKKQYNPLKVITLGNHEDRGDRFANEHPSMDGFVDVRRDLQLDRFWDTVVGFKREYRTQGMSFSHFFPTGIKGQPISGVSTARTMALKLSRSAVQGHSHLFDVFTEDRGEFLPNIWTFSCGCFSHPDQREGWNKNTIDKWAFGVLHLYDVVDGEPKGGFTWRPLDWLQSQFS